MKKLITYIDELKAKFGSDNKAASAIGVSREVIAMIRKRKQMSDETACKIAKGLGIESDEILLCAAIARSRGETRKNWVKITRKYL